jgi:hypothetical protein
MEQTNQTMELKPKAGPWSKQEKLLIAENAESLPYEEIARRLRRNPEAVRKYIQENLGRKIVSSEFTVNPEYDIQSSPIWKTLKAQFSDEELKLFLYHWSRIISQFKDDVFPTEELQIIDTIKIEILLDRTLRQQRAAIKYMEDMESEIASIVSKKSDDIEDQRQKDLLERQLVQARISMDQLGKSYNELLAKKNLGLQELKGTRAERVKSIENSKQSMLGWIAELLRNKKLRRDLGIEMEKMRLAVNVEEIRLMEPHKYIDNNVDYPILNSTLMDKIKKEQTNESTDNGS